MSPPTGRGNLSSTFPTHVLGSYCEPDIGALLFEAIGVIQTACGILTPPG